MPKIVVFYTHQDQTSTSSGRGKRFVRTKQLSHQDETNDSSGQNKGKNTPKKIPQAGYYLRVYSKNQFKKRDFGSILEHLNQVIKHVFFGVTKTKIRFLIIAVVWCCLCNGVALQACTHSKFAKAKRLYQVVLLWLITTK